MSDDAITNPSDATPPGEPRPAAVATRPVPIADTRNVVGDMGRVLAAELIATAVLVLVGVGSIVLGGGLDRLEVSLAFGVAVCVMIYATSSIGGAAVNPAVTLGLLLTRRVTVRHAVYAWVGQVAGGLFGAGVLFGLASGRDGFDRGAFGSNGWNRFGDGGSTYGLGSAIVVEVVLTAVLVMVALSTTNRRFPFGFNGLAVGLTMAIAYIIALPIDGAGVNPARSIAAAAFADGDSDALVQLWAFIVFPLVGAFVGVVAFLLVDDAELEDTMLDTEILRDIRDTADRAVD